MIKALIILLLTVGIFGSAAYWTYELFVRPDVELKAEKQMPPPPPPPDPSLGEFEQCRVVQKEGGALQAKAAWERFLDHYPQSSKIDEAKDLLGELNMQLFLSPVHVPEKEEYVVKSGDVLGRVAAKMKTTPELLMRSNQLNSTMLQIGQRLLVSPGVFSLQISKRQSKVTLLRNGKFFKQYHIEGGERVAKAGKKGEVTPAAAKQVGKVTEKIAWAPDGQRVTFSDKGYAHAAHWVVCGHTTLYSLPDEQKHTAPPKPPGGLGLKASHMDELAALLRKGDVVTLEP